MDQFQEEYIRQEQLHRRRVKAVRRMLLVLLLALWELCTRLNIIDGFIFSSPSRVLFCLAGMIRDGSIWEHLGITLFETIVSFLLVTGIGIFMAVILWSSRTLAEILEPYLVMLNSLPKSALAPMLIVWFGSHVHTIVVAAISVAVFGSIMTLHAGFQETDPDKIRLIRSLGGGKKEVHKSSASGRNSADCQQYEGQCRTLSRRCDHRRVPIGKAGTRLSDYLQQSDISA